MSRITLPTFPLEESDNNSSWFFEKQLHNGDASSSLFVSSIQSPEVKEIAADKEFHTNQVNKAFQLVRLSLSVFGRWPFPLKLAYRNSSSSSSLSSSSSSLRRRYTNNNNNVVPRNTVDIIETDLKRGSPQRRNKLADSKGNEEFTGQQWSYQVYSCRLKDSPLLWMYFILTTTFLAAVLIFSVLGFCDFFLDWQLFSQSHWDKEESNNFQANLVPFVLVWSCLLHSSISSISILLNRKKLVKYLNYTNVAVDSMDLQIPKSIKTYVILSHLGFVVFLVIIYISYKILYLNIIRGGSTLLGILTFRPVLHLLDPKRDLSNLRVFGVFTIIYATYASRMFLLMFSFSAKLILNGFQVWNQRFKRYLKSPQCLRTNEKEVCSKLFADYRILLNLVRMTDEVFGAVLQSYYGSQLLNMCFELYYLARSKSEDANESTLDIVGALIVLFQNIYIFFAVSLDAAYVNEEATKGLEILRRTGINPDDNVYRKYLISNLLAIYSQRIVFTGGKFFAVDRPFIITVLGAVFTYFIIVLQIGPSIHQKFESSDE